MTQEMRTTPANACETCEVEAKPGPARTRRTGGPAKTRTKSDGVVALLSRSRGATIDEMMMATGWQAHSVRGFLAGTVKKKLGRPVASEVGEKGRIYRITSEAI